MISRDRALYEVAFSIEVDHSIPRRLFQRAVGQHAVLARHSAKRSG